MFQSFFQFAPIESSQFRRSGGGFHGFPVTASIRGVKAKHKSVAGSGLSPISFRIIGRGLIGFNAYLVKEIKFRVHFFHIGALIQAFGPASPELEPKQDALL